MLRPVSQVVLTIKSAFQEELITDSGLRLFLDSSYRKEWNCAVTATIAALPVKYPDKYKKIIEQLKVGDECAISYSIVADFHFANDGHRFMPYTEGDERVREFVNAKGEWVRVYALPGKIAPIWVGAYLSSRLDLVDGVQGTEHDVERWMSQFEFGKTDTYTFNNYFEYEGKDYWKCELDDIFAKKVDGHWVAVSDRIICTPIDESFEAQPGQVIDIEAYNAVKFRRQDRALVQTGGKSKGIKRGDIVSFNPKYLEKYEFDNKQYYLIREDFVLGTWKKVKHGKIAQ